MWHAAFLAALANSGNVRASCAAAGISRTHVYRSRREDDAFARSWDDAMEEAADVLEAEARRRATVGGSDVLLIFLLKGARPEKYRDRYEVRQAPSPPKSIDAEFEAMMAELKANGANDGNAG